MIDRLSKRTAALCAALALGIPGVAAAHGYRCSEATWRQAREHDRLRFEHEAAHRRHPWMTPWEHRRLHRILGREEWRYHRAQQYRALDRGYRW